MSVGQTHLLNYHGQFTLFICDRRSQIHYEDRDVEWDEFIPLVKITEPANDRIRVKSVHSIPIRGFLTCARSGRQSILALLEWRTKCRLTLREVREGPMPALMKSGVD